MAVYTIHIPRSVRGETPSAEKIVFLRDGFSVPAFLFGPFWLVWRRAWLAAAGWTALLAALAGAGAAFGLSREGISILELAANVVLGFEGSRLVAWTLTRRGYAEGAVTVADSIDEAEEVFFRSWRPDVVLPPRAAGPGGDGGARESHVVGGLFGEPRA